MKKSILLMLLFASSCHKRTLDSATMFTQTGDLKDKLALVHMIDSSATHHSWDVASELSLKLEQEIARKNTLYVIPVCHELTLSSHKNPFGSELAWLKSDFPHTHYVAFTELLKYEKSEKTDPSITHELEISLRVRVFKKTDSGFEPILQEIVQQSYLLPSFLEKATLVNPQDSPKGYELSPLGVAHHNFTALVGKRIRDYIKQQPQNP